MCIYTRRLTLFEMLGPSLAPFFLSSCMCIEKKKKAVLGFFGASGAFLNLTTDRLRITFALPSFSCCDDAEVLFSDSSSDAMLDLRINHPKWIEAIQLIKAAFWQSLIYFSFDERKTNDVRQRQIFLSNAWLYVLQYYGAYDVLSLYTTLIKC